MSGWLRRLDPESPPALDIAVRAQHLKRWECPRGDYPMGRAGYLQWRRNAARHHARVVTDVLEAAGCDRELIERVALLVEKRSRDRDGQTLEDCACLVFLESRLAGFSAQRPPDQVARIVRQTWHKMSPAARRLAEASGLSAGAT